MIFDKKEKQVNLLEGALCASFEGHFPLIQMAGYGD
jgi:hypothetical protein